MNSISKLSIERALKTDEQIRLTGDPIILKKRKTRYSTNLKEKKN